MASTIQWANLCLETAFPFCWPPWQRKSCSELLKLRVQSTYMHNALMGHSNTKAGSASSEGSACRFKFKLSFIVHHLITEGRGGNLRHVSRPGSQNNMRVGRPEHKAHKAHRKCLEVRSAVLAEKYSWQWEDSREANRSTWASLNRLQISRIVLGWSRHSPGNLSCRESASAARLSSPRMWTARSDLSCVWLQRRRWQASCDMRRDHIPPNRLMYETAAVLSVRTNTCLPNSSGRNCRKARCISNSSRQLMCQSSQGPVQSPEAACLLHVAPQPVLEASVVTTTCRYTCSKGTPARRKARSIQGLKERRHSCVMFTQSIPRRHAHLGTRECNQCWSGLIWSNLSGVTAAADAICPRSLWNCSSGTTVLPLKELRSALTGCARLWGAPSYSPSLTPHREKRFPAQGRARSFPSWPKAPTGWGAGAPGPCDRTTVLMRGPRLR